MQAVKYGKSAKNMENLPDGKTGRRKNGTLPPSERKIVTKETHQGCLSFAITGFSELKKF